MFKIHSGTLFSLNLLGLKLDPKIMWDQNRRPRLGPKKGLTPVFLEKKKEKDIAYIFVLHQLSFFRYTAKTHEETKLEEYMGVDNHLRTS